MITLSREVPIDPAHAALLIVDVQNYCAHPDGAGSHTLDAHQRHYLFASLRETVLPNLRRLQSVCRRAHIEVVYAAVENMTGDGRDRSLDYKISGIDVPRGSWDARVLDEIAPAEAEMIFRKTSSSVFISTNIDYVLRNLGVRSPSDPRHRRLRHRQRRAPRTVAHRHPRLLPPTPHGSAPGRDRDIQRAELKALLIVRKLPRAHASAPSE